MWESWCLIILWAVMSCFRAIFILLFYTHIFLINILLPCNCLCLWSYMYYMYVHVLRNLSAYERFVLRFRTRRHYRATTNLFTCTSADFQIWTHINIQIKMILLSALKLEMFHMCIFGIWKHISGNQY